MPHEKAQKVLSELLDIMMYRHSLPEEGKALEIIEHHLKKNIYLCPKCEGDKLDYEAVPSPMIGGGDYRPPCKLCDGKGYIKE